MKTCIKCGGNKLQPFDLECRHDFGDLGDEGVAILRDAAACVDVLRAGGREHAHEERVILALLHVFLALRSYDDARHVVRLLRASAYLVRTEAVRASLEAVRAESVEFAVAAEAVRVGYRDALVDTQLLARAEASDLRDAIAVQKGTACGPSSPRSLWGGGFLGDDVCPVVSDEPATTGRATPVVPEWATQTDDTPITALREAILAAGRYDPWRGTGGTTTYPTPCLEVRCAGCGALGLSDSFDHGRDEINPPHEWHLVSVERAVGWRVEHACSEKCTRKVATGARVMSDRPGIYTLPADPEPTS